MKFIRLTIADENSEHHGDYVRVNAAAITRYSPDYGFTRVYLNEPINPAAPPYIQVREAPEEIDKLLGIQF